MPLTNGNIVISYELTESVNNLVIELYSLAGQKINIMDNHIASGIAGEHSIPINLSDFNLSEGMYFIKLTADEQVLNERIIYSK